LHEKIASQTPNRRRSPACWGFGLYEFKRVRDGLKFIPILRRAIREHKVLHITCNSLSDERAERRIRPLQADYWGRVWTLST
jgi:predicted DNA-binding transcriptional regulator YafY